MSLDNKENDQLTIVSTISDEIFDKSADVDSFVKMLVQESLPQILPQIYNLVQGSDSSKLLDNTQLTIDKSEILKIENKIVKNYNGSLLADLEKISSLTPSNRDDTLKHIDDKRLKAIQKMQSSANEKIGRQYTIESFPSTGKSHKITISHKTKDKYFFSKQDIWVNIEKYLYGTIYSLGGKNPTVRIETDDVIGKNIVIQTNDQYLTDLPDNKLYKKQLVRVKFEQNIETNEIRNIKLISFEDFKHEFDEKEFDEMIAKGRQAWKDVPNASEWVEKIRGNLD